MTKLRDLFFHTKMTWLRVVVFAVATAVATALILILPFTAHTSLANIGATLECWILFALIIILNCEKPFEAGLKTFVFFLISQPLIYLFQVPFSSRGWELFEYYGYWFVWTLLCFPGAMIAWYVKKDNLVSALILSVATAYLGASCVGFGATAIEEFPHQLIAALFCAVSAVGLIVVLLKKKSGRLLAVGITLAAAIVTGALIGNSAPAFMATEYALGDGTWRIEDMSGDTLGNVHLDEERTDNLLIAADHYGTQRVVLTDDRTGETRVLLITYGKKSGLNVTEE